MSTSPETRPARSVLADLPEVLGWGARLALLALMTWIGSAIGHPYGPLIDLAIGFGLGLALLGLGSLSLALLRWVAVDWTRVLGPAVLHATIGAAAMLIAFGSLPPLVALAVWGAWLVAGTGMVLTLALLRRALWRPSATAGAPRSRAYAAIGTVLAGLATVAIVAWWWWPGSADPVPPLVAGTAPPLALPDPGVPGPLAVATLRYGSGLPHWRPEYGEDAAFATTAIDLADLVELGRWPARSGGPRWGSTSMPCRATRWCGTRPRGRVRTRCCSSPTATPTSSSPPRTATPGWASTWRPTASWWRRSTPPRSTRCRSSAVCVARTTPGRS
ncbi:MAG: hypothetical protein U5J97_09320 [Trueperaceae bacterium]|nr:hypothetical protein [Trueperaceae bacterium]